VASRPTADRPLLLGLLADVSGSMTSSVQNDSRPGRNRLDSLRDSLDELVARAAKLCIEGAGGDVSPRMRLFAYGFGFGNPLAFLLGDSGEKVRDLLDLDGAGGPAVGIDHLARDWQLYRDHIGDLVPMMLGDTPMAEAFEKARHRVQQELSARPHTGSPILFVVSDGEPTDAAPSFVAQLATQLKQSGVIIVSCLLTNQDLTEPRRLYGAAQPAWPPGAQLMFECASLLPSHSPFDAYLIENRWNVEPGSRLFTQINQSSVLEEFSKVVLSPLSPQPTRRAIGNDDFVRVFITYSHLDSRYLEKDSLYGYISALKNERIEFFTDRTIAPGEFWDEKIRAAIKDTDIVLAFVTQAFLNSDYCRNVEIAAFLERRRQMGTVIIPVILSPCDWRSHEWLAQTQAIPTDGKTLEGDFRSKGKRDQFFLNVLDALRTAARAVRG
jgi:hypothetical protein